VSAGLGWGGFYTARDARFQRRVLLWMLTFALAYVAAAAALRFRAALPAALPWLAVGAALALAFQVTRSYVQFLRGADELLRRIEIEALALGFAAGSAFAMLYPLLVRLGAPAVDGYWTALVMMLGWAAGGWLGLRRYSSRAGQSFGPHQGGSGQSLGSHQGGPGQSFGPHGDRPQ